MIGGLEKVDNTGWDIDTTKLNAFSRPLTHMIVLAAKLVHEIRPCLHRLAESTLGQPEREEGQSERADGQEAGHVSFTPLVCHTC